MRLIASQRFSRNRAAIIGILGGSAGKAATLGSTLALAAILETVEYAHFAALHLTAYTVGSILASGTSIALNHQAAAGATHRRVITFCLITTTVVLTLSAFTFDDLLSWLTGPEATLDAGLTFLVPPAIVLADNALASLAGRGLFKRAAYFEGARGIGGGVLILILGMALGPTYGVLAIALVDAMVGLTVLILYRPLEAAQAPVGTPRESAIIAIQGTTGSLFMLAASWAFQASLTRLYGLEVFAAFNLCVRLTNLILLPPNFASRNMLSQLLVASASRATFVGTLKSHGALILSVATASSVGILVLSHTLLAPVVDRYEMSDILFVTVIVVFVRVGNNFLGVVAIAVRKRGIWLASDICSACIVFLLLAIAPNALVPALYVAYALGVSVVASVAIRTVGAVRGLSFLPSHRVPDIGGSDQV